MCHVSCVVFGIKNLAEEEVRGKKVLEIGSYNLNGGLRPVIESWGPSEYVGVDMEEGPGVDVVCTAENLLETFQRDSFDTVVSTEMLEHVRDWKKAVSNIKNVCKPGGTILLTTRSLGFCYHGCPNDFWRYDLNDMRNIFTDCDVLLLQKDHETPGVFLKARKPEPFFEKELGAYQLHSIVVNKRVNEISDRDLRSFYFKTVLLRDKIRNILFWLTCNV